MKKTLFFPLQVSLCTVGCLYTSSTIAYAQVTSDGTINTQVNQDGNSAVITGGETRGGNLFHSFQDFSVVTGNEAFFNNVGDISNIFSRVTGGNISNIDGAIRANGSANLFLINPAGIIFGENARLDIGGSFYGTSATSVLFEDGEFSAADLENPPLLTVNAPIGLGLRDEPGDITVRGVSTVSELITPESALRVNDGNNLSLLGGNINLEGGKIIAPGGRVDLGGLLTAGEIEIGENSSFNFPDGIERANVALTDFASVNVTSGGGGSIGINAKNLILSGQSELFAGIAENMGSADAQAGDITINATESIQLTGSGDETFDTEIDDLDTAIRNHVGLPPQIGTEEFAANFESSRNPELSSTAIGNAGSIIIQTDKLEISDRAALTSKIYGIGNTGNIQVTANEIVLDGGDLLNQVRENGIGDAGNISVNSQSFSAQNSSFIISDIEGEGNGGNIEINASEQFLINGTGQLNIQIGSTGKGNAGNIAINTTNFSLQDGADIFANVIGEGKGGNVEINASNRIIIEGTRDNYSDIFTSVGQDAQGNAGSISLNTQVLEIRNGTILSFTNGQGNAGNLNINVSERISLDGSNDSPEEGFTQLNVQVQENGVGNAGEININTRDFSLEGGALILANTSGNGNAGNIRIDASGTLNLEDGSGIFTNTGGNGSAGNIDIDTNTLSLTDGSEIRADTSSNEDAGNIRIETQQLTVSDGAQIATGTIGEGSAGNLTINASEFIKLAGQSEEQRSGLVANAIENSGSGGELIVNTGELTIEDGATITVGNFQTLDTEEPGTGEAGNINIVANSITLDNEGEIDAATQSEVGGNGANINLQVTEEIKLRGNSFISAQAFKNANGGNLTIDTDFIIVFPSNGNGSDIIASAERGEGGNITINAESLLGITEGAAINENNRNDIDASSQFSLDGNITINTPDSNIIQGAIELPSSVVELGETTQQACKANRESAAKNRLNITGRGGIVPDPALPLNSLNVTVDSPSTSATTIPAPIKTSRGKIQPARGIQVNELGEVILTAYRTDDAGERLPEIKRNCDRT